MARGFQWQRKSSFGLAKGALRSNPERRAGARRYQPGSAGAAKALLAMRDGWSALSGFSRLERGAIAVVGASQRASASATPGAARATPASSPPGAPATAALCRLLDLPSEGDPLSQVLLPAASSAAARRLSAWRRASAAGAAVAGAACLGSAALPPALPEARTTACLQFRLTLSGAHLHCNTDNAQCVGVWQHSETPRAQPGTAACSTCTRVIASSAARLRSAFESAEGVRAI